MLWIFIFFGSVRKNDRGFITIFSSLLTSWHISFEQNTLRSYIGCKLIVLICTAVSSAWNFLDTLWCCCLRIEVRRFQMTVEYNLMVCHQTFNLWFKYLCHSPIFVFQINPYTLHNFIIHTLPHPHNRKTHYIFDL